MLRCRLCGLLRGALRARALRRARCFALRRSVVLRSDVGLFGVMSFGCALWAVCSSLRWVRGVGRLRSRRRDPTRSALVRPDALAGRCARAVLSVLRVYVRVSAVSLSFVALSACWWVSSCAAL